jgi:hypothetical protein
MASNLHDFSESLFSGGAMAKVERIREEMSDPPAQDYWQQKSNAGWRLAAVEWIREQQTVDKSAETAEEIPYGLKIADDCVHLEPHPGERETLLLMLEMIVRDRTLTEVAAELNERGLRTRRGTEWGPAAVFNMLPRMIDVGPRVFSQPEWATRRQHLFRVS